MGTQHILEQRTDVHHARRVLCELKTRGVLGYILFLGLRPLDSSSDRLTDTAPYAIENFGLPLHVLVKLSCSGHGFAHKLITTFCAFPPTAVVHLVQHWRHERLLALHGLRHWAQHAGDAGESMEHDQR